MNKILVALVLLCVSLNGYASCFSKSPEEMSYYAYMTESELLIDYCYCKALFDSGEKRARELLANGQTGAAREYVNIMTIFHDEMNKIQRVLKKDYNASPKNCEE